METQIRSAHKILVQNPGVKRSLRKLKPIWGDNIKLDLTDMIYLCGLVSYGFG